MEIERKLAGERASHYTIFNKMVFLRGVVAQNPELDFKGQTQQCLDQIEAFLIEAGSNSDRMLSATVIIRNTSDFAAFNEVWDSWIATRGKPTRACYGGTPVRPEILVEFIVVAAQE